MLGFTGGVMVAASFWSLLAPAIEMSGGSVFPAAFGFGLGALFIFGLDKVFHTYILILVMMKMKDQIPLGTELLF